jgi:hypothetical protein
MWELRSFVRAVLYGETPLFDGYDGRMAVANAHAILQAMGRKGARRKRGQV